MDLIDIKDIDFSDEEWVGEYYQELRQKERDLKKLRHENHDKYIQTQNREYKDLAIFYEEEHSALVNYIVELEEYLEL